MTVNELVKLLRKYPGDMEIVNGRMSDYQIIKEDEWHVIKGVLKDGWVMGSHHSMSKKNKEQAKEYLFLAGN